MSIALSTLPTPTMYVYGAIHQRKVIQKPRRYYDLRTDSSVPVHYTNKVPVKQANIPSNHITIRT